MKHTNFATTTALTAASGRLERRLAKMARRRAQIPTQPRRGWQRAGRRR